MPHQPTHNRRLREPGRRGRFAGPAAAGLIPTQTREGEQVTFGAGQLSGNVGTLRAGGQANARVDFSQLDFGFDRVSDVDLTGVNAADFLLSGEQQRELGGIRRSASARGLFGGAVRGVGQARAQQFLAQNQAQGFRNVVASGTNVFNQANQAVRNLEFQVENLSRLSEIGRPRLIAEAGEEDIRAFAQPLFEALVGFGQERALTAGLALSTGERRGDISSFGLSGEEENIARAVQQFLNPRASLEQLQTAERRGPNVFRRNAQVTQALAENRIQAGQSLLSTITRPRRQLQGAVQELRGAGAAAATLLSSGRPLSAEDLRSGLPSLLR